MIVFFGAVVLGLMVTIYYFIISSKMNKAAIAFSAGAIVLFLAAILSRFFPGDITEKMKLLTLDDLSTYVDFKTLGLLIGMMILIPFIEKSGFFQIVAIYVVKLSKGNLKSLFIITGFIVALCSAFLNNVSTVMVFVPIILAITDSINKNPFPFLIMVILSANLGGAATLIGDPPNMLVGFAADISFVEFLVNLSPVVFIAIATVIFLILKKEKKYFSLSDEQKDIMNKFLKADPKMEIKDKKLLKISLTVFVGAMIGFVLPSDLGIDPSLVSLLAAAIILLILKVNNETMEYIFKKIEWETIFFFLGMFTVIYGLQAAGVIDQLVNLLVTVFPNTFFLILFVLWFSLLLSGFLSAVPMVMIMIPLVQSLVSNPALGFVSNSSLTETIWWALVLGACFGGNTTSVGAAANIVVTGMSKNLEKGSITFSNYVRYSFPKVMITGIIASVYIIIRIVLF
ncbi:MAG: hypothetical protein PWQ77_1234 [Kosmotogales bacterium]|nr:hypothetical protein [Kosmotogales bacterium]